MATDFLMLQRYPQGKMPRLRHYEWTNAAFTFGYSQKIEFVRTQLPSGERLDLCRRPTGGGLVDHRSDWTYALVIPRGHPLEEQRATQSYRAIHEAIARSLAEQGIRAVLKQVDEDPRESVGICFERAEIYDVVDEGSGAKIAGAAQKRNKHGLLFQGSITRTAVTTDAFDWARFEEDFQAQVAAAIETEPASTPWPEFNEDELAGLIEQYSSPEWIAFR